MNRRRSEHSGQLSLFVALVLSALVTICGGITHAVAKNSQVKVEREIDQAKKRIEQTRVMTRMVEVRSDKLLDRFDMKKRLEEHRSTMVAITPADIQEVIPRPEIPAGPEVAAIRDGS